MLCDALEDDDKAKIKKLEPSAVHSGFGRFIRNTWSLWEDTPLTRDIKTRFKIFGHGDDNSAILLHMLWEKVIGRPPWFTELHTTEALVEEIREHWRCS